MIKTLPFKTSIPSTWVSNSHLFAILQTREEGLDWLVANFIQLRYADDAGPPFLPHLNYLPIEGTCKLLTIKVFGRNIVDHFLLPVIGFLKFCIDNGSYISININQQYIRGYNQRFDHTLLVYGYDDYEQFLYVADHFDYGAYAGKTAKFEDFEKGYNEGQKNMWFKTMEFHDALYDNGEFIYKGNDKLVESYKTTMLNYLKDYCGCTSLHDMYEQPLPEPEKSFLYGFDCYDAVIRYLKLLLEEKTSTDRRIFTQLRDHKYMMPLRAEMIGKYKFCKDPEVLGWLKEKSREAHNLSEVMLCKFIKYEITKNKSIVESMVGDVVALRDLERIIIEKTIQILSN